MRLHAARRVSQWSAATQRCVRAPSASASLLVLASAAIATRREPPCCLPRGHASNSAPVPPMQPTAMNAVSSDGVLTDAAAATPTLESSALRSS